MRQHIRRTLKPRTDGHSCQAPSNATPPAYYIADFELTDPEGIRPYTAGVVASFPSHPTSFCDGAFALHCNADASKGEERS